LRIRRLLAQEVVDKYKGCKMTVDEVEKTLEPLSLDNVRALAQGDRAVGVYMRKLRRMYVGWTGDIEQMKGTVVHEAKHMFDHKKYGFIFDLSYNKYKPGSSIGFTIFESRAYRMGGTKHYISHSLHDLSRHPEAFISDAVYGAAILGGGGYFLLRD
jgi:hypothetical protein